MTFAELKLLFRSDVIFKYFPVFINYFCYKIRFRLNAARRESPNRETISSALRRLSPKQETKNLQEAFYAHHSCVVYDFCRSNFFYSSMAHMFTDFAMALLNVISL
jgi:hypothetical protein